MKRIFALFLSLVLAISLAGCGESGQHEPSESVSPPSQTPNQEATTPEESTSPEIVPSEGFVLISGGTLQVGSPEDEPERSSDETQHDVTVSSFYMAITEVSQKDYQTVMGTNPSENQGNDLPVTNITWYAN